MRELAREAVRNLRAAPIAAVLLATVVALTVGVGTMLEANEARRARAEVLAQIRDGGWVSVARSGRGIDARACRQLVQQRDVLAAGGVGKPRAVALTSAPGTLFEAYRATPEFVDVLVAHGRSVAQAGQVAVGAALARELGLVDGSQIAVAGEGHHTVLVLPVSARADRFSRAVVVPAQPREVDECWVEWVPGTPDVRHLTEGLLAADRPLTVSATLTVSAYARDPFAQYAGRWTRWWCVPVGAVVALVFAAGLRARVRAAALYAAVGTSRPELAVLFGIEVLLIAVVGTAVGLAWGLALFAAGGEMTAFDAAHALPAAVLVPAGAVVVTVIALQVRRVDLAAELKAD